MIQSVIGRWKIFSNQSNLFILIFAKLDMALKGRRANGDDSTQAEIINTHFS